VIEGTIITRLVRNFGPGDIFVFIVTAKRIHFAVLSPEAEVNELDTLNPETALGASVEFNLVGIKSADVLMTGGLSDPFNFSLTKIVR
jgi:hypothetical protein